MLQIKPWVTKTCPVGRPVETLNWEANGAKAVYSMVPRFADLSAAVMSDEIIVFRDGRVVGAFKVNEPLDTVGIREMAADMAFTAVKDGVR